MPALKVKGQKWHTYYNTHTHIYNISRFSIEQTWECLARFTRSPIKYLLAPLNDYILVILMISHRLKYYVFMYCKHLNFMVKTCSLWFFFQFYNLEER